MPRPSPCSDRPSRAAALAGCGRGDDVAGLGEAEKVRWRQQARQWLRADLAAWRKASDGVPDTRMRAREALMDWQRDPDLSGLRESGALDKLPAEERKEWFALWKDAEALLHRTVRP
jgi:eukaryotic-like serine/threonine-protein kinase